MTTSYKYTCDKCMYNTNVSQNYNNHMESKKHKEHTDNPTIYCCDVCNKPYFTSNGLRMHKQKCKKPEHVERTFSLNQLENIILELKKQPVAPDTRCVTDIFLNDKCKGAVDFVEFISHLTANKNHFQLVGEKGYIAGYVEIFKYNLKKYSFEERPLFYIKKNDQHTCHTIYIRHNKIWIPETHNSNLFFRTVVDELDMKISDMFEEYELEHGKMKNRTIIINKLSSCWDKKDEVIQELLNMTTIDNEQIQKCISESIAQTT